MLLAIDIGNTNIVLGVFEGETLTRSWRLATQRERTSDEFGVFVTQLFLQNRIDFAGIDGIIVSSVVPPLTRTVEEMAEHYFSRRPLTVDPRKTGMPVLYTPAGDVGADRVVNAVAAYERYGRAKEAPVIVVDFGTATTWDVVSPRGEYLGGVIAPGITISSEALYEHAAKLPRVELARPGKVVARNTVASMQAGLVYGYAGMVDALVERIRGEIDFPARCIATGGLAPLIATETRTIEATDELLTLKGLKILYQRNA